MPPSTWTASIPRSASVIRCGGPGLVAPGRLSSCACHAGKAGQDGLPGVGRLEGLAHLLGMFTEALEVSMAQFELRAVRRLLGECHLDLGLEVRIELPVRTDLP